MSAMPSPNVAMYTEDVLTAASVAAIAASGFTTVIVGLFHVHADGSFYYNNALADASAAASIASLKATSGSSVQKVFISIGGGNWPGHPVSVSDTDYPAMKATWTTPATGQTQTSRQNILAFMASAQVDGLDLDYEPVTTPFDVPFIAQVTTDIAAAGYLMSAAPYTDMGDWQSVLQQTVNGSGQNLFARWNLQLYGGADYASWVAGLGSFAKSIGLSQSGIQTFLVPGYSLNCPDTPVTTYSQPLDQLKKSYPALDGAFIWNYTSIASCLGNEAGVIINTVT